MVVLEWIRARIVGRRTDGHPLRIPVTHEAVKRYNDFMPMKRAIEHFMVGNTDRAKEFLKECEHVNLFNTNPK